MISHTKLRSAIDGLKLPNKKQPCPSSQKDSIIARDAIRTFSASAALFGFNRRPTTGASLLCRTS